MIANAPAPTASAAQFVLPSKIAVTVSHRLLNGPSASIEMPKSLGSWLTNTVNAMPFM